VSERAVVTDDAVSLWTAEDGSGQGLVLCHGGPGLWDYLAPVSAMARQSARVVRWDQRGCGRSGPATSHSVQRYVEDLEAIRNAFGFPRWIVGGHSWGATLALQYALRYPDRTRAVIYVSGTGIGRAWHAAYHDESDRRRTEAERSRLTSLEERRRRSAAEEQEYRWLSWFPDFASRDVAADLFSHLDAPFAINVEANRCITDETKAWSEANEALRCTTLDAPVLLIHGDVDPRPAWAVDSLAAALPNASVEILRGVGHYPWLEAPAAFSQHLQSFLFEL
jgi:proline iminopeptidase